MRIIKYYDRIHRQLINLEVTDEVAKFLMQSTKQFYRSSSKFYNNCTSLETKSSYYDNEKQLSLMEILEDTTYKQKRIDACLDYERQMLYKILWRVFVKLSLNQQSLLFDLFFKNLSQKDIAKKIKATASGISQLKATAIKHLKYYFYNDEEFTKTKIYRRYKKEFDKEIKIEIRERK